MSHDYHPRTGPISEHGPDPVFWDGCADCERKAKDPCLWGEDVRRAMWGRMIDVEFGSGGHYRSTAEGVAGRRMYELYVLLERFFGIDGRHLVVAQREFV